MLLKCKSVFYYDIILNRGDVVVKIISIKEPFATLIKDRIKTIETRSWNTKYRGEIYIHASLIRSKSETVPEAEKLVKTKENPGFILCKCALVDCVEMTDEYLAELDKTSNDSKYLL